MMTRWGTFSASVLFLLFGALLSAQAQPQEPQPTDRPRDTGAPTPLFRSGITLMTAVVIPRDRSGAFLADLTAQDFLVFEDDQPQQVVSLVRVLGGRASDQLAPPLRLPGGLVLPPPAPPRAAADAAGRLFVILVDDLNIEAGLTPRTRMVFEQLAENVIREGDRFGIVSTGPSAIAIDLTNDRSLLDAAAARITADGFGPNDLIENFPPDTLGVAELMVRARMAFRTMRNIVRSLEQVQQLRKVVIYLSGGYDFNPFLVERAAYFRRAPSISPIGAAAFRQDSSLPLFGDASHSELAREILELATAANRANASFYTVDPRGLVAGPEPAHYQLNDSRSFNHWIFATQNSLRSIAEQTGGRAFVNRNDFDDVFRQIDAETSDYYILGFALGNSNTAAGSRKLKVEVRDRDDVEVQHRSEYRYATTSENRPNALPRTLVDSPNAGR